MLNKVFANCDIKAKKSKTNTIFTISKKYSLTISWRKHIITKGDKNANKYDINEPFIEGLITHEDIGIKKAHNIKYLSVMLYLLPKISLLII